VLAPESVQALDPVSMFVQAVMPNPAMTRVLAPKSVQALVPVSMFVQAVMPNPARELLQVLVLVQVLVQMSMLPPIETQDRALNQHSAKKQFLD
jgi:hypothetical protein